ncbi:MAG: HIRAN domain-containing protein [Candidatus Krumholzibacteria bacterium]|nr:HIRAN domain-containing protein [Candidatus Krumholzibacteria bacterium]
MPTGKKTQKTQKTKTKQRRAPATKLLGEIFTEIAGMQYYEVDLGPGEKTHLEREPDNQHDNNAIRIENKNFKQTGYVPRRISSWLAPLVDSGEVWVEGHVAESSATRSDRTFMLIELYLHKKGRHILQDNGDPSGELEAIHQAVLTIWSDIERWTDPDAVEGLGKRLKGLADEELLPKTRMLLGLFKYRAWVLRRGSSEKTIGEVRNSLQGLKVGKGLYYHNLTIFPLTSKNGHPPDYLLLQDALKKNLAEVREVSEEGSIPELLVENRSPWPILIPEGEVLIGAKQDRTVNITILINAMTEHIIPVSCVEQGRWARTSLNFAASHFATPGLRARKIASSQEHRRATGQAFSNQSQVWDDVAFSISGVDADSETGSLADAYKASKDRIKKYRQKLVLPKNATGILVTNGEDIVGMDLFDCPKTLRKIWPRLSESYFLEAVVREKSKKSLKSTSTTFMNVLPSIIQLTENPSGPGQELEFSSDDYAGSGIWYNGHLCHLSAFKTDPA